MATPLETFRTEILELEQVNKSISEGADSQIRKEQARERNKIARIIVWAFVAALGAIFALVIVVLLIDQSSCSNSDCQNSWKEGAEYLGVLLSSVMLPIVTLVLGFYFGTEQSKT